MKWGNVVISKYSSVRGCLTCLWANIDMRLMKKED